jgi:hypothetical protein
MQQQKMLQRTNVTTNDSTRTNVRRKRFYQ